jgi:hypothetical protein
MTTTWSPIDIAWAAGLIEGEGSIQVRKKANGASVVVQMTDEDVLKSMQSRLGIGTVNGPYGHAGTSVRKPRWMWQIGHQRDVARLLLAITPMMGVRRREQIDRAVDAIVNARMMGRFSRRSAKVESNGDGKPAEAPSIGV